MNKTQSAVDIFNRYADQYQNKYMDVSLYHDSLNVFCNLIPEKNASILDVACGPGNITKYLSDQRPDFKIQGIDLSPNMIKLAAINNPEAEFQLMDCRDIDKMNKRHEGVVLGFCLPYLSKEESLQLVNKAAKILTRGGVLYLSTMEDDYSKSGIQKSSSGDEIYMHYHQADYLENAIKESNLKIVSLTRLTYSATDGTPVTDLIIIAQK
jgi:trans-aconitate methyltransferase